MPTAVKADGEPVNLEQREPLRAECKHFLDCIETRTSPVSDGAEGLRVLRILDACQRAIVHGPIDLEPVEASRPKELPYFAHESAYVD